MNKPLEPQVDPVVCNDSHINLETAASTRMDALDDAVAEQMSLTWRRNAQAGHEFVSLVDDPVIAELDQILAQFEKADKSRPFSAPSEGCTGHRNKVVEACLARSRLVPNWDEVESTQRSTGRPSTSPQATAWVGSQTSTAHCTPATAHTQYRPTPSEVLERCLPVVKKYHFDPRRTKPERVLPTRWRGRDEAR